MKTIYQFNTAKWNKERGTKYTGTFRVQGEKCKIIKSDFARGGVPEELYEVGNEFGESDLDFLSKHFTKVKARKSRANPNLSRLFKFNRTKWNKVKNQKAKGSYVVEHLGKSPGDKNCFLGKVVSYTNDFDGIKETGRKRAFIAEFFDEIHRAPNGKFAKKPAPLTKFKFFLREIQVVPVIVEAATLNEAEKMVREGDGDYQNKLAIPSDLSADDYFDSVFEKEAEVLT